MRCFNNCPENYEHRLATDQNVLFSWPERNAELSAAVFAHFGRLPAGCGPVYWPYHIGQIPIVVPRSFLHDTFVLQRDSRRFGRLRQVHRMCSLGTQH